MEDLKAQQQPSTPPEVIEESRKTTADDVEQIKEGENLYTEVVDTIYVTWELIPEDKTMTNFAEYAR